MEDTDDRMPRLACTRTRAGMCMVPRLTWDAACDDIEDSWLQPLDSMAVMSSTPPAPMDAFAGAGVDPKPTYLPPWLGGSPSGLLAFCCCMRAKYASFCAALASSCARVTSPSAPDGDSAFIDLECCVRSSAA
jgi:hypothetical protein